MRILFAFLLALSLCGKSLPKLQVAPGQRHLVTSDGKPFFFLADTAYDLLTRLTFDEAETYLKNRVDKRFTVTFLVGIRRWKRGTVDANRDGEFPLHDLNPARPNEAYWKHVDRVIERAREHGLYVGLFPTWGDQVTSDYRNGVVDGIFTPENAESYGRFLGSRYKSQPHLIWILGGDRAAGTEESKRVWRAMAQGIAIGVSGKPDFSKVLMTYHPVGPDGVLGTGFSSDYFHDDEWLDFNLFQTGHRRRDVPNYEDALRDYKRMPAKPTLDGESRYEDHWINSNAENGRFDDYDQRQAAYWSVLSGSCGHTYGNNNVWQMWEPGRAPAAGAHLRWSEALNQPGAGQMTHVRALFESVAWHKLVPEQELSSGDVRAAQAKNGSFLVYYTPVGKPIQVTGECARASWFDPRTGKRRFAPATKGLFVPPSQGRGQDWVLIIDRR